jgi:hypothetical protein
MTIRLFLIIAFTFAATAAHANVGWSSAGTACAPTGDTVGKYVSNNAAGVKFAGTEVGDLVFTCSMDRFDTGTTNWVIKLTYRDTTGTDTTASVVARIYSLPIGSSSPNSLKSVSSNSSAVTTTNMITSTSFNHAFDFDTNVYFAQVTLSRTGTQTVIFYSVVLDAAPPM